MQSDNRARMLRQTDPYLRERMSDFDDLANRLVRHLTGDKTAADPEAWPAEPPRFQLQLYGAGHVGRAIVGLLAGVTPVTTLFGDSLRATLEERYRIGEAPSGIELTAKEPQAAFVGECLEEGKGGGVGHGAARWLAGS